MKKYLLVLTILMVVLKAFCQPNLTNLSFPASTYIFDLHEISFNLGHYSNPYDPDTISAYAIFTSPDNRTFEVPAFYYEDYTFQKINGYENVIDSLNNIGWRIRFTPDLPGTWYFRIYAIDKNGTVVLPFSHNSYYNFTCIQKNGADGFIRKANSRFLKREYYTNGNKRFNPFYPVGPNIAWYSCKDYGYWKQPRGIYDYERYIDSLVTNGNYMRFILNRFQYLNLYGPEYTQCPIVYFDSTINQKDAAELDHIITYAAEQGISLMMCIFQGDPFRESNSLEPSDPSIWSNNPYNTILQDACDFFTDTEAIRISKNLIRYIVSRWGYATNIMCWELWNEVNQVCVGYKPIDENILDWHIEMAEFIRDIDPFHHLITTSMVTNPASTTLPLYLKLFGPLDVVQQHNYQNIQQAASTHQISYILYNKSLSSLTDYPTKPFFMGEFGFGQRTGHPTYQDKDPYGIDLHNSLWSSMFSSALGPGSFWWWSYIDTQGLFERFKPILTFCNSLPILSGSFRPYTTGKVSQTNPRVLEFPNNIETYYLKNTTEDTIFGWCQDTAFCYQSLRRLTDSVRLVEDSTGYAWHFVNNVVLDPLGYVYTLNPLKRPGPSSNSNTIKIPIENISVGTQYKVKWYNSETGLPYTNSSSTIGVYQDSFGNRFINIEFPSFIRNLQNHTINNTFGDAVFKIILKRNDY